MQPQHLGDLVADRVHGDSEDIGSWKIIAISRAAHGADGPAARVERARSSLHAVGPVQRIMEPETMRPGSSTICRMERAVTLLPLPLSPTMHSVRPRMKTVEGHAVHRAHDAGAAWGTA